jgi:hypothetical protein
VERPLDDEAWRRFSALQERRPGGFRIAALMRPPAAGEDEARWLERAREAQERGPLGLHTHWTAPDHARPTGGDPAEAVREQGSLLRSSGLRVTLFCGGGWYLDEDVADAVAELGYADCTATAFMPSYIRPGMPHVHLAEPGWLRLRSGRRLLELPTTHSIGMLARAAAAPIRVPLVHAYFHDFDLLEPARLWALRTGLAVLGRRRAPSDLDEVARTVPTDQARPFPSPP